MATFNHIRGVVTDIEGTTTDIDFVHKVLFPYSAQHLSAFVATHAKEADIIAAMETTWQTGLDEGLISSDECDQDMAIRLWQQWIIEDRKHPALKTIQGKIWREGYAHQAFTSHVYADVTPRLAQWHSRGLTLAVYSSGSVEAQKQLFAHTNTGDITPFFQAFFDTKVGAKRDVASYQTIASQLDRTPATLLFLSDIAAELDAARQAGWQTAQLIRDERTQAGDHPIVSSFAEILLT